MEMEVGDAGPSRLGYYNTKLRWPWRSRYAAISKRRWRCDDDDVTVDDGNATVDVGDVKIDTSAKPIVRGPGYHAHTCTLPRVRREDPED